VLTQLNGKAMAGMTAVQDEVRTVKKGDRLTVGVTRGGTPMSFSVTAHDKPIIKEGNAGPGKGGPPAGKGPAGGG
jgi:S1-C subfamily serine protease